MLTKDRALALATLLMVAVLAVESLNIRPRTAWQPYGSAFFPQLLLAILGVLAAILLVRSFLPGRPAAEPLLPAIRSFVTLHWRIPVLFALFGLYALALPRIGFIAASIAFITAGIVTIARGGRARNALLGLAVGIGVTLIVYAIFHYGLRIRLP